MSLTVVSHTSRHMCTPPPLLPSSPCVSQNVRRSKPRRSATGTIGTLIFADGSACGRRKRQ